MRKLPPKVRNIIIALIVVVAVVSFVYENYIREPVTVEGTIEIHSIDVGQGDSTLIIAPEGNLLIDAGTNASETDLLTYLDFCGIDTIDYFILTHPHEDHIGGADAVFENYEVKNVVLTFFHSTSNAYDALLDALKKSVYTNVIECEAGAEYSIGEMKMKLLGPDPDSLGDDANNSSIITKITYGESSLLFTGDAEYAVEIALVSRWGQELDCDFLKMGHHGSSTSNSQVFVDAVSPYMSVISCGKDNSYGHPHREIIHMLENENIEYYRTDKDGSIVFVCDGKRVYKK